MLPSTSTRPQHPSASVADAALVGAGLLGGVAIFTALAGIAWAAIPAAIAVVLLALVATRRPRRGDPGAGPVPLLDPVTGVPTRAALVRRLGAEVARARRHAQPLTVLHVDLAGFNALSAAVGPAATDELLRRTALGMAATLRGEDLVARHGTDSFVVLLPGLSGEDVDRVIARIGAAAERVRVEGVRADPLHVDVGVARFPADGQTTDALLTVARERLGRRRDARLRIGHATPAEPEPAPVLPCPQWPVRGALLRLLAGAAAVAALWFLLPLVVDAARARLAVVGVLVLAAAAGCWLVSRHVSGRERSGWLLLVASTPLAAIPYAGALSLLALALAILLIAGDGWLRDRIRILDALVYAGLVAGGLLAFALPSAAAWDGGTWPVHVALVVRGIGACAAGATVLLVVTSVSRRARPDVWMLAAGYALLVVVAIVTIHRGGVWTAPESWRVLSALVGVNAIVVVWLRLHHPGPASRVLRDAGANGAYVATVGTAGFVGLMVLVSLVQGAIAPAVVAALVAIALIGHVRARTLEHDNRRLVALALRSQAERSAQNHASLLALTAALEARDGYTGRHGEETTSLTSRVALALGLSADERREIDSVALLHDVGKIGTPNEILHKAGPLTDAEWVVMREHPVVGERILRQVPGFEAIATAVRHEHERWDGGGYPDGISGEEIPLASRIVLVCDAFHAMTSDRPYRRAMPLADALAELERHAGSQFDPAVVRALVDLMLAEAAEALGAPPGYQAAA